MMTEQPQKPANFDQAGLSGIRWLARLGIVLATYEVVSSAVHLTAGDISGVQGLSRISNETCELILACGVAQWMTDLKDNLRKARRTAGAEVSALSGRLGKRNDGHEETTTPRHPTALDGLKAVAPALGGVLAGVSAVGMVSAYAAYGHFEFSYYRLLGGHDINDVFLGCSLFAAVVNGAAASALITWKGDEPRPPGGRHAGDAKADLRNGKAAREAEVTDLSSHLNRVAAPRPGHQAGGPGQR